MSERSDRIRDELLALQGDDEKIHVATAVKWARRHRSSELHRSLEWDDAVAGELHRQQQVRDLIVLHVISTSGSREFVSLSIDRAGGGGYRPMEQVLSRPALRDIMLRDALHDLERLEHRYKALQELASVWSAASEVKAGRRPRKKAS